MRFYVIYLKNYARDYVRDGERQEGYVSDIGLSLGQLTVCHELDGAVHYPTEDLAEQALLEFEEKFDLDREEANIKLVSYTRDYALELNDGSHVIGISVTAEGDTRLIAVRHAGFEASADIPEEVADLLGSVLAKIERRLSTPANESGGNT